MAERTLDGFVRRSLAILEHEHPAGYRRLHAALGRRRVELGLDGDPFVLAVAGARIRLEPAASERACAAVELGRATVVSILDGEVELLDAVLADHLHVRGSIAELGELWDATRLYLHGLIRCPSIPPLLDALRDGDDHHAPSVDLVSTNRENPRDQPDPP